MESLVVECLSCGASRVARQDVFKHFESPECPNCGYLGWAPMLQPADAERHDLREHPFEERRVSFA